MRYQEVRIQELPDQVPIGHIPRAMTVQCRAGLTRQCSPGEPKQKVFFRPLPTRMLNLPPFKERALYFLMCLCVCRFPSECASGAMFRSLFSTGQDRTGNAAQYSRHHIRVWALPKGSYYMFAETQPAPKAAIKPHVGHGLKRAFWAPTGI